MIPPPLARLAVLLCAVLGTAFSAPAQFQPQGPRIKVKFAADPAQVAPGEEFTLTATVDVQTGWHVYGSLQNPDNGPPIGLNVTELSGLRLAGTAVIPPGKEHDSFGMQTYWLSGRIELTQKLKVPSSHPGGEVTLSVEVPYQACDHQNCELPTSESGQVKVVVAAAGAEGGARTQDPPAQDPPTTGGDEPADAGGETGGNPFGFDPLGGFGDAVAAVARIVPEGPAAPGDEVTLEVTLQISEGRHLYGAAQDPSLGAPVELTVTELGGLRLIGKAEIPDGELHEKSVGDLYYLEGKTVLRQRLKVLDSQATGSIELKARVDYTACTEEICDDPAAVDVSTTLEIQGSGAGAAPDAASGDPEITFSARANPGPARAGELVDVIVTAEIPEGWHAFAAGDATPMTLRTIRSGDLLTHGELRLPEGDAGPDGGEDRWLTGRVELAQSYAVPSDAEPNERVLRLEVEYQLADADGLIGVQRAEVTAAVKVEAGEVREEYAVPATVDEDEEVDPFSSLWALILASIGAGLFALVMPCTYPMIPITISFFTKQAESRGGKVLPLSLAYGAGIIAVFVIIGVLVGPLIVPFARHWITNLIIAVVFLAFGLSLFGFFTLQPPRFLTELAGKAQSTGGYLGVFLMGTTLVITSFTCTAPFVGTLLSAASSGGLADIAIGMAVFGVTMATPFVLLSLLPGRVRAIPRAGAWMNTVKVTLGFVEVAASLKFFSNAEIVFQLGALPRELFLLLWVGIFVVAGLYLLGMFKLKGEDTNIGAGRMTAGLAAFLFAAYCMFGTLGYRMDSIMTAIVPPYSAPRIGAVAGGESGALSSAHTIVKDDYEKGLQVAAAEDKLLLVNFTGYT